MVLRLRQHNVGYTATVFTGLMTQPTVSTVKALKEGG